MVRPQQTSELRERLHRMGTYNSQDFDPVVRQHHIKVHTPHGS